MDIDKPIPIKDVELSRVEIVQSHFKVHSHPTPGSTGQINYSVRTKQDFKTEENATCPSLLIERVEATLAALLGETSDKVEGREQLFSCDIELALYYNISTPKHSAEEILAFQWHFHTHACLLARSVIKDMLKDTVFASVPVPFGA